MASARVSVVPHHHGLHDHVVHAADAGIPAANVAMVPATLAHGGHRLTDLIGGVVIFALALGIAALLLPRVKRT